MSHQSSKTQKDTKALVYFAKGKLVSWSLSGLTQGVFPLLIFFQSCSPVEVKNPSPAVNTVKKGEKFRIILPENHSESFMWKLDQNKKNAVDYLNAVWHGDDKGIYYHFEAMRPGQDTLNFALYKFNEVNRYTTYIVKVE